MKATNIQLIHYRSAKQLSMNLEPDLTVLVGVNGAGKSTVLDALAIALSWATARVITPRGSGRRIGEIDIHNDKNFAWIELGCRPSEDHDEIISWRLTQTRKGRNPIMDPNDPLHGMTSLKSIRFWANQQRKRLSDPSVEASLPLLSTIRLTGPCWIFHCEFGNPILLTWSRPMITPSLPAPIFVVSLSGIVIVKIWKMNS